MMHQINQYSLNKTSSRQSLLGFLAPTNSIGLVDRSHIVVDLENLCGGSDSVPKLASKMYRDLSKIVSFERMQVVVAVGINAWLKTPELGFLWPNARYLVGRGIDGADIRLVEDLVEEPQALRSARVVIASGDGRFANCAEILTEQGVEVMVVARHESLSRRLSAAASSVIFLPE
jgi:uncharacterized LabA/DUF88 family protein